MFPQLDRRWSGCLFVCLLVVKPVFELTLADEDEFSENVKQLQRHTEGGSTLPLNKPSMKNRSNSVTLSSFEFSVCFSLWDNIITHTHFSSFMLELDHGGGGVPQTQAPQGHDQRAVKLMKDLACCCFYFNSVIIDCACVLSFLQGAACSAYRVNRKMPVPPPPPPPGPPPPPTLALVSGCELINDIITQFSPF